MTSTTREPNISAGITPIPRHVLGYGTSSAESLQWAIETGKVKPPPAPARSNPQRSRGRRRPPSPGFADH